MAARRPVSDADVVEALGHAVTRAIHWAPESLLVHFSTRQRQSACSRLAIRVVTELAGDGWREGRGAKGGEGLDAAIVTGIAGAGEAILGILPEVRRCNGRVLDGVGLHIGAAIHAAMQAQGARLARQSTARSWALTRRGPASLRPTPARRG